MAEESYFPSCHAGSHEEWPKHHPTRNKEGAAHKSGSFLFFKVKSLVRLVGHAAAGPQAQDEGHHDAQAVPYMDHPAGQDEADGEGIHR
jgi:hypothetical protein